MNEERSRVAASSSFMSLLHVLRIKALFYILWFLWGGGGTAELTPQLVFNGVPLAHMSIIRDLKLLH